MPEGIQTVAVVHLMLLSMWGGLVVTEAVVEFYPFRRKELHRPAILLHYWIDLLLEAPLLVGVLVTGLVLAFTTELTNLHYVKIVLGSCVLSINLVCIVAVVVRRRRLARGDDDAGLWRLSKRILLAFIIGLPLGGVVATLGFMLAAARVAAQ